MDMVQSGAYERVVLGWIDTIAVPNFFLHEKFGKKPEGIEAEAWNPLKSWNLNLNTFQKSKKGKFTKFICPTAAFEVLHCWGVSTKRCATERKTFTLRLLKCEQRTKLPICANCHGSKSHRQPRIWLKFIVAIASLEAEMGTSIYHRRNLINKMCDTNVSKMPWLPVEFASQCCLWKVRCLASHGFTVMLAETATFETRKNTAL